MHQLQNKTIPIFRFPRIPQLLAQTFPPFNLTIQHYHPINQKHNHHSTFLNFHQLLSTTHPLTIHPPLTPQTHNLFHYHLLTPIKLPTYLLNTPPPKILNTNHLVQLLNPKHIQPYAPHLSYPQPPPPDHPST
ncbi:NAD(P)-dependent oxidoreductase, partial [Staphylococcus saprophyticus]|uniref:NAD(P)-dependent oxidoreductase n=1 Tax=Staphylococcus saprophyticus TaxID=29385 RepID=UPI0028CB5CA6